ncbi:hypothetical protein [Actinomarinicola tropica]|uniref:Uncharacterized protein n=1 Tax=Actinomarinicola tropica TaxID=2789776 RepID=A0A5Q2RK26_9ACTN|nr:hypothetical protein [Actinomarinicola tropica]QGG94746.1 hypothetical protein GH723_06265 [Actinomarinicola tropica]
MPRATRPAASDALARRLAERAGDWVLPFWLERQTDPGGPDATPAVERVANVTHRERIPVGTLGSAHVATVDPRGLVTPHPGGWSLDWWVGADDRWHVPCREVAVRQSRLEGAPVVETAMRVPGGDVVHRAWAFNDAAVGDVLAVEVENATRVPVALALSVRPYGPDGAVAVGSIEVREDRLLVDGRLAAWLPRPAARLAGGSWSDGDAAQVVLAGDAPAATQLTVRCDDGLAQVAMVVPLAHTATVRLLLPLDVVDPSGPGPTAVPPPDAVARGWRTHADRGTRVEIPDAEVAATFAAARADLLLASTGRSLSAPAGTRTTATVVRALDRCGLHDEADAIVASLPDGQGPGGRLGGADPDPTATGAALAAAGWHWQLGRDDALLDAVAGQVAAGAHHRPASGRFGRRSADQPDPATTAWLALGSRLAAVALDGVGQADAAAEIRRRAADLTVDAATLPVADAVVLAALGAVDGPPSATDVLDVHDGAVVARTFGAALSPELTARRAQVALRRGDRAAREHLRWLVDAAGPRRGWPELVHPRSGGGAAGAGWSVGATAAVVDLVLDLFAVAVDDGLLLCPVLPDAWLGAGFEVHGLPTDHGRLSYAVRWHGERPALLWELERHADGPVTLRSPGLDPDWSTTEVRGEALLAVPPHVEVPATAPAAEPVDPGPAEGQSFG